MAGWEGCKGMRRPRKVREGRHLLVLLWDAAGRPYSRTHTVPCGAFALPRCLARHASPSRPYKLPAVAGFQKHESLHQGASRHATRRRFIGFRLSLALPLARTRFLVSLLTTLSPTQHISPLLLCPGLNHVPLMPARLPDPQPQHVPPPSFTPLPPSLPPHLQRNGSVQQVRTHGHRRVKTQADEHPHVHS